MRALLVVNPAATATSARTRDVLARALGSRLKVDVAETRHRGHACELARQARRDDFEVVLALGGDGTVNEVVNGLLAAGVAGAPALGVLPGGSTNVFARAIGLPADPVEATGQILDALQQNRRRVIGLGRADERWFTFCAGLGLDAEVVDLVERSRAAGRLSSPALYLAAAVRHFYLGTDRRSPALTLQVDGQSPEERLYQAIVCNTAPWTYLRARPVNPLPLASFDTGLDVFALRRLTTAATLRCVARILVPGRRPPRKSAALLRHDLAGFTLRSARPLAFQVDGDALGQRSVVRFTSVPEALHVLV